MDTAAAFGALRGLGPAARELVLPARCAGCGARGYRCCPRCRSVFDMPRQVYPASARAGTPVYALAGYRGAARRLVLAYKERDRRDLAQPLGAELAEVLPYLPPVGTDQDGVLWVVPAPSRRSAARVRGGSHTHALAKQCARLLAIGGTGCAVAPALRLRSGARDAVGLDRAQRADNLALHLRTVGDGLPPAGSPVVLLDDVVTTGATSAACVDALREAGRAVTAILALTAAC